VNAEHARPMMAYVALCLAASFVLGRGAIDGDRLGPIDVARAGQPVQLVKDVVTLTAAHEFLGAGVAAVPAPIRRVVASSATGTMPVRQAAHTTSAGTKASATHTTQHVAAAPTLSPAPTAAGKHKLTGAEKKAARTIQRSSGSHSAKADKPAKAPKRTKH